MRRHWGFGLLLTVTLTANSFASEPEPLPKPELTEPFAIGEALLDPARVDQAVVSLVRLFGIPLSENRVRGLIEMGRADLAAASNGRLPWSFKDLHAAVAPMLPDLTIEAMAQAYTSAYRSAPESNAARLMLGMPLKPGTRLTRPQLWLLLVDGFARPAPEQVAQLGGAVASPGSSASYGTASLALPQIPSPMPGVSMEDWAYLLSVVPLLAYDIPFDIQPLPAMGHEGHGGTGAAVTLQAKIGIGPRAVVGPTGNQLLLYSNFLLNDRSVDWRVQDRAAIERHGSFDGINGVPVRTDMMGAARLTFTPKVEDDDGRGLEMSEGSSVTAAIKQWDLVSTHYQLVPQLMYMLWGEREAPGALVVGWHEEDAIQVRIENIYEAFIDFGGFGDGWRKGTDIAEGTLALLPDGTAWEGIVEATIKMTQELHGPGVNCGNTTFRGTQQLRVRAEEVGGPSRAQTITHDTAASTAPPGGAYLALDFVPIARPRVSPSGPCMDLIQRDAGTFFYLPLNDARWTVKESRYVIELPESSGVLVYRDGTVNPASGVAGSLMSVAPVSASSYWKIRVEKP